MTDAPKGRRRSAPPADETEDGTNGEATEERSLSFGQEMRERAQALEPPPAEADLHERIAWVFLNVPDVPKLGHADVKDRDGKRLYTYDYVREPEMMNAIRPLLGRAGVAAYANLDASKKDGNMTTVRMTLTLVHKEIRETIGVEASGTDKGERATIKAVTTGMRYLLQKQFQIATDGIDPEKENVDHEPSRSVAPREAPRPARPRRASGKPTDLITPAARGTIYQHARSRFISDERVLPILSFASEGKIDSTDLIKTNEQLDWAYRQLDRYADDPEAGEAKLAEAGIGVVDRTKLPDPGDEPELPPTPMLTDEELRLMNESDAQPPYTGGDDDVPF